MASARDSAHDFIVKFSRNVCVAYRRIGLSGAHRYLSTYSLLGAYGLLDKICLDA